MDTDETAHDPFRAAQVKLALEAQAEQYKSLDDLSDEELAEWCDDLLAEAYRHMNEAAKRGLIIDFNAGRQRSAFFYILTIKKMLTHQDNGGRHPRKREF